MAVRMRLKGAKLKEITETLGLTRSTIISAVKRYNEGGWPAVDLKKRGRKTGTGRRLTPEQESEIQQIIQDKTPDQLKMPFALWTRGAVVDLIKAKYDIDIPIRTMGHYLKRWGFTPQKPIKKAYEQNPKAVEAWLEEEYPTIQERAKAENTEIHWGDETGLRSDDLRGRGYAPKGETPVVRVQQRRESFSMISTVTNRGKVRWMTFQGGINVKIFLRFLGRLIKGSDRKIFLILDNLRVHHAKKVKEWLANRGDAIELFFLPSYSPELNPDECLNSDLKQAVTTRAPSRAKGDLKKATLSHMKKLSKSPQRVRNYFKHEPVRYAA